MVRKGLSSRRLQAVLDSEEGAGGIPVIELVEHRHKCLSRHPHPQHLWTHRKTSQHNDKY